MRKIVLTFGLIAGAVMGLVFLAAMPFKEQIGFGSAAMAIGYASMVAAFMLVYFGVRRYRDTIGGGTVGFGRALGVGMLIVCVASSFYVATWEIYYFAGNGEEYITGYSAAMIEAERAKGTPQAELDKKSEELRKFAEMYRNPVFNSAMTFLEPLPVGVLIALVSAGLLKRRRAEEGL